jgi:aspartyl-tRNA(Asn)/glutamyl-tRNA(Gln) amidotransferase subunit B
MSGDKLKATIGLEVHAQLSTKSKIFCGCSTSFGAPPNTHTCPVCLGLPGVLPVFNRKVLDYAMKVGLALGCKIAPMMKFDRKNYFYPDLPKDFQISQFDLPLAADGSLEINSGDGRKTIRIKRVHLEEDAGKLTHIEGKDASLVDYNRCGTPLLEIVSEPDLESPEEAYEYLTELKAVLKYLDVSDCNMEEGSLRCDANISMRPASRKELGVKAELKNMNSFKGVKAALGYEIARQREVIEDGGKVTQETRLWNEAKQRTFSMRAKEEAFDYRYFPEPDLVPLMVSDEMVAPVRASLPELPRAKRKRFAEDYKLQPVAVSTLASAHALADFFEESIKLYNKPQVVANWITGDILSELNKRSSQDDISGIESLGITPGHLADMLALIDRGEISGKIAKSILPEMIDTGKGPKEIVESKGLSQIKDKGELDGILDSVISAHPQPVADYKSGKAAALTFLVGQVMKASRGKANPKMVNELLKERMEKI